MPRAPLSKLSKQDLVLLLDLVDQCRAVKNRKDMLALMMRLEDHLCASTFAEIAITPQAATPRGLQLDSRIREEANIFSGAVMRSLGFYHPLVFDGLDEVARDEIILRYLTPYLREAMRATEPNTLAQVGGTSHLTSRETEILRWAMAGKTNWEISEILAISERTVKFHIGNIMSKLQASSRSHAIAIALRRGLISH